MPNLCASCNEPAEWSCSADHPAPFTNQWLCRKCYVKVMGVVNELVPVKKVA